AMAGLAPEMRRLAQRGDDLGARMANLVTDLLAAGHAAALVTGSDLPTLPARRFTEAAPVLTGGPADVGVGPTEDGGYYLIGLARPAPALFADMRWSAPDVLAVTCERAQRLGLRVHRLPPWYDVDTAADLVRLRDDLASVAGLPAAGAVAWRTRRWLAAFPGSRATRRRARAAREAGPPARRAASLPPRSPPSGAAARRRAARRAESPRGGEAPERAAARPRAP